MFTACFVITEYCNMECSYCYMKNKRNSMMKPEVFDYHYKTTLPYFMKHYGYDKYKLDLFGGEPTTYWKMIKYIVDRVSSDEKLDHIFLPTNGLTMTPVDVAYLKENNVKVSLSFDGIWAEHLNKYIQNKMLYKVLADKCSVCVTPDHMNMSENFKFLMDEFQLIPEFKIVRDDIWKTEHVDQFKEEIEKLEETYIQYMEKNVESLPFEHNLLMLLESRAHQISKLRCFVGNSGVAFGANKKVYPCARFLTSDYYPLYDGDVALENLSIVDEFSRKYSDDCMKCEQSEFCNNMCLHQEMKNGLMTNVCDIYKEITEMLIRINHKLKRNETWKKYIREHVNG